MASIQLSLTDATKAQALLSLLARSTQYAVECTLQPDPEDAEVVVVDPETLHRLPLPLRNPERVVLIARAEPGNLKDAWEAGVNSVVSDEDPLNTVVLAILSACLRKPPAAGAEVKAKRRFKQ